ncbi:MAG: MaoC family dehydratase N-terminal domain-containing protein [Phycicoccus sp.]|nr:MaoC family dehydratase N-terminal domain-containing protein [Phycicoccus sp.]
MSRRSFDDVVAAQTFGPVEVSVSRPALKAYADASGDQNRIHQDEEFATSVGLPTVIAHGMWTMGATSSVLTDWVGDAGAVLQLGTRFTNMVLVPAEGNTIEVTGVVKSVDEVTRQAKIDLTTTCNGTKVLGRCQALVQLA